MSESRRINPDSIGILWVTVVILAFLQLCSFMVSFAGLSEVANWVGIPTWMSWTIPAFIDVSIIGYSLAVLIQRSRGESTRLAWSALLFFTAVSIFTNGAHALSIPQSVEWQGIVGAGVAALSPIGVFMATEVIGQLIIARPDTSKGETLADLGEQKAEQVEPSSAPAAIAQPASTAPESDEDPEPPTDPEPEPEKPKNESDVEPEPTGVETVQAPIADVTPERVRQPEPVAQAPETASEVQPVSTPSPELNKSDDVFLDGLDFESLGAPEVKPTYRPIPAPKPQVPWRPSFVQEPKLSPIFNEVIAASETKPAAAPSAPAPKAVEPEANEESTPAPRVEPAPVKKPEPRPVVTSSSEVPTATVMPMDPLERWIVRQVQAGNTPRAKDAAEIIGASERTARRKLAVLKESKPALFDATSVASKEA